MIKLFEYRKDLPKSLYFLGSMLLAAVMFYIFNVAGFIYMWLVALAIPFLYLVYKKTYISPIVLLIYSFILSGLGRYFALFQKIPFGLGVDGLLVITVFILLLKNRNKYSLERLKSPLIYLWSIWFIYNVLEIFNPESLSKEAWFYAMRGSALYVFLTLPIIFLVFNKVKHFNSFLLIWGILSLLGSLKGMQQIFIGLDPAEQAWIDGPKGVQHVLFGQLRAFSFYSEAGTYGASQAQTALVMGLIALNAKNTKSKIFYAIVAFTAIIGLLLSGTRGPVAIPAVGGLMYLFLNRNIKILVIGLILMGGTFYAIKYTSIASSNYYVNRVRSAFDPENPSLQARIKNQKRFADYLSSRPFGGGVGSAGIWGLRFTPYSPLSQIPTDSWFVRIWAETGIVGLILHVGSLLWILIEGSILILKVRSIDLKQKLIAVHCGYFGILVASYGNEILGQHPISMCTYFSMAFVYLSKGLDAELNSVNCS